MLAAIRKTSAWPLAAQFACTLAVITGAFFMEFPLEEKGVGTPFTLFLSCVCIITLLFGRPSGFLAVAITAPLGALFFVPVGTFRIARAFDLFQIECYAALAVCAILILDQVRRNLMALSDTNTKLAEESTQKALQLREVAHRVANNFASLDALIRQRAMASKDPKIQFAFEQASELLHVVARLNNRLNTAANNSEVDSGIFVSELCEDLQACARDGVHIRVQC
jgi:two-component system, sensor histidine kinase PdtaS